MRRLRYWAVLAVLISQWITSLLFGVRLLDPITYAAALIGASAVAASYIPARQAASVGPMETLRSD